MDPIELSVHEIQTLLNEAPDTPMIDVREDFEREIVLLPNSLQLTEELAEDMIKNWQRDQIMVFYCHHGWRSRSAAEYFLQQGFTHVRNMTGGIDAWSRQIAPELPRY